MLLIAFTVDPYRPLTFTFSIMTVIFYIKNIIGFFTRMRTAFVKGVTERYQQQHGQAAKHGTLRTLTSIVQAELHDVGLTTPQIVSRAFSSWKRSILSEIYLCHACSYQEIEDGNARTGMGGVCGDHDGDAAAHSCADGTAPVLLRS
eukprot:COSAG01_NODE_3465_length_6056_cov_32.665268_4_plen_147_part_00